MFMSMYPLHWTGSALEAVKKLFSICLSSSGNGGFSGLNWRLPSFYPSFPSLESSGPLGSFSLILPPQQSYPLLSATAWPLHSASFFSGRYLLLFWALDHPNIMAVKKEESL